MFVGSSVAIGRSHCITPSGLTFLWSYLLSCMGFWGQIWNHGEFCSAVILHISAILWCWQSKHTNSYARIDFCHGWWVVGAVWVSTIVHNQLWRGCETRYWSRVEKSVTVVLYNYWWSQKMPRAKHNLLFVMLGCLSSVSGCVFCSCVPIPCLFILCAVSFHISLAVPSWKMNTGFVQEL